VIAGEGSRTHALQRALIVHGMAPWLDVPGRLSQALLRDLHGRADAFVTPADRESFGIAALEARAAGLPVVARRDGGAADLLVDGVEALLADDDAAAGRALGRLLCDAGLRGAIAAHNRTVPVVFTWEATARLVDRAYALAAAVSTGGELALQGPAADAGSPPRREGA
jgi:phosphatidylinositol alpha 1,6-mannosyltransferase